MSPDVFVVDDDPTMGAGNALPEYYDEPKTENKQVIEIEPPIEIIVLDENTEQAAEEPIEIRTINLTGESNAPTPLPEPETIQNEAVIEQASPSLILNPYPLDNGNLPAKEEQESVDLQMPVTPAPIQESAPDISWNENITYEVIEGFGMDLPMALALGQIVPPQYAYSFGDGVNPGIRISWEGGKAWDKVLNDALTPVGMKASIKGKKVVLSATKKKPSNAAPTVKEAVTSEPVEASVEASMPKEFKETPEQSMSASLEEDYKTEEVDLPAASDSVVLDKKAMETEVYSDDDGASALVKDLMQPLDSFENGENVAVKPEVITLEPTVIEEPAFKPEIILDEKEKEEEEYAKKLEETNPFEDNVEPIELLPISDTPAVMNKAEEATGEPATMPFEEEASNYEKIEEPTQASDVIDEEQALASDVIDENLTLASTKEMVKLEPSSHFRDIPSNKIRVWEARRNSNLQNILSEWSAKERVPLKWNATDKYTLDYDVFISGTFQNAIDILFKKGLKSAPEYAFSEYPYEISVQEDED
jgi:hypothetical protein